MLSQLPQGGTATGCPLYNMLYMLPLGGTATGCPLPLAVASTACPLRDMPSQSRQGRAGPFS